MNRKKIFLLLSFGLFLLAVLFPAQVFGWQANCRTGWKPNGDFDCGWDSYDCNCGPPAY